MQHIKTNRMHLTTCKYDFLLFVFGGAVVVLMIWLPDGLLSIPDRIKARQQAKKASAARAASAQSATALEAQA